MKSPSRADVARKRASMLPVLADPKHPGVLLVRHVGIAIIALLAAMGSLVFFLGSTVRLTIAIHAQGLIEGGAAACTDGVERQPRMPAPEGESPGKRWCARLWVDDAVRERLSAGAPVKLRVPPQGLTLHGQIAGFAEETGGAVGSEEQAAPVHRVVVEAAPERDDAVVGILLQHDSARPVDADITLGSMTAKDYLVESLTGWLYRRDSRGAQARTSEGPR
ncbi:hypothetical protein [Chondromyces crocatus]|uniref:Uncharacterized protein n=1 Tax=Chondromyces crocatus TaxID=52 RepID=A0A0K1EGB5_CHOCO|nr:hypothetical protein [Chondromyces crocatus]AKT39916.1 uncharacterized protein CMC5_040670 [Chondromyces crocatus]